MRHRHAPRSIRLISPISRIGPTHGILLAWLLLALPSCDKPPPQATGRTVQIPADPGFSVVEPGASESAHVVRAAKPRGGTRRVEKLIGEWGNELPDLVFRVTRMGETEPRFTGAMHALMEPGAYHCFCCGAALFSSRDKYVSGTGWPSFTRPADNAAIWTVEDDGAFQIRVAVLCSVCDARLGHKFDDGPEPARARFSINASALRFVPESDSVIKPETGNETADDAPD